MAFRSADHAPTKVRPDPPITPRGGRRHRMVGAILAANLHKVSFKAKSRFHRKAQPGSQPHDCWEVERRTHYAFYPSRHPSQIAALSLSASFAMLAVAP